MTLQERLRKVRRILNETDEKIDRLPFGASQTDILRSALAEIAIAIGPQDSGKRRID